MKRIFALLAVILLVVSMMTFVSFAETTEDTATDEPVTESIADYVKAHLEEISVIVTLILTMFYEIRKHGKLNGSIGTLNNNAITVAENSASAIKSALEGVESVSKVVEEYKGEIASLLAEIRKNEDEKRDLTETLSNVKKFLETSKIATLELSNEVAELLVLANIPNSKKEELYARHIAALKELKKAEEGVSDDGTEA